MMFLDKYSIKQSIEKKQIQVFGLFKDKWKPAIIKIYKLNKNIKIIVWGIFWESERSSLYIIDRDFKFKKFGYSANLYIEVLDI